jgi:hypothetical protein
VFERLRSFFRRRREAPAARQLEDAQQIAETRQIHDDNVDQAWQARAGQPKTPKQRDS